MIHITTGPNWRNELENLALAATILAGQINPAITHINRQLNYLDGFPTGTGPHTAAGTQRTANIKDAEGHIIDVVPVTSIEAVIVKREQLAGNLADIFLTVNGMKQMTIDLSKAIHRALLATPTTPVPRCSSAGRDGADEWGDPGCWDMPARGALCPRCYMRERRWRQAHGLPTRDDAVA